MLEKFCKKINKLQKVFKETNFNIFLACLFPEEEHQMRIYRSASGLKDKVSIFILQRPQ